MSYNIDLLFEDCRKLLKDKFDKEFSRVSEKQYFEEDSNWESISWVGSSIRKIHMSYIDKVDTYGLRLIHVCIFPSIDNPAPIFGFDIIAGKNKITGMFHDYSLSSEPEHSLNNSFKELAKKYFWAKERILPPWANEIFSPTIILGANIKEQNELEQIKHLLQESLELYFSHLYSIQANNLTDTIQSNHSIYCHFQKENPHTPRMLMSIGMIEEDVNEYIYNCLFPF